MIKARIRKTRDVVLAATAIILIVALVELFLTSNELGLPELIHTKLLIPLFTVSIALSVYWILLTDDFWNIYNRLDVRLWTFVKTGLKFFVWGFGMLVYFYVVGQGLLSIYNRTVGEQKRIEVSGLIVDKHESSGKYTTRYYFEINDLDLGRNIEIKVDDSEYKIFDIGDNYTTKRSIGALGLIYEMK